MGNHTEPTTLPLSIYFQLLLSHAHDVRVAEAAKEACLVPFVYKLSRPVENISFSLKQSNRTPRLPR